jgi:hypothetical protein
MTCSSNELAREPEDVHPLGHHDRTIGCDVDDAEVDTVGRQNLIANPAR